MPGVYNYRSWSTVCLAVRRTDGKVALAIGITGAKQGAFPRPHWLASEVPIVAAHQSKKMLAWADGAIDRIEADGGVLIWEKSR